MKKILYCALMLMVASTSSLYGQFAGTILYDLKDGSIITAKQSPYLVDFCNCT